MSGKLLRLSIESYKGIQNLSLDWENEYAIMALIADGGIGKSSVLEFVEACLDGIVPDEAINTFTNKAKGSLEFEKNGDKFTVEVSKTKKSETVKIRSNNNMSGGKEVLRKIVGSVAIAPFALMKMDVESQVNEFKKIFTIDTAALDGKRKATYDQRTIINGQIKSIVTVLQQADIISKEGTVNPDFKEKMEKYQEEKSTGDLPDRIKTATDTNEEIKKKQADFENTVDKIQGYENDMIELDKQIQLLQQQRNNKVTQKNLLEVSNDERLAFLKENQPVDMQQLETELHEINDHNTERGRIVVHVSKIQELEDLQNRAAEKTKALKETDKEIDAYIKSAIPELVTIKMYEPKTDEEGKVVEERKGIYWNDKPISILSKTEAITFGMELKSAVNPDGLQILLLDDFESVGSLGRAALEHMAGMGWQALIAEMDLNQTDLKVVLKKDLTNVKTSKTINKKNTDKKEEAPNKEETKTDK